MNEQASPATDAVAANPLTRNYRFDFRSITAKALDEVLASVDTDEATVRAAFDTIDKDGKPMLKRKSVTVPLTLPDFCLGLDTLAQDVILGAVASFVKAQYLDAFVPVGDHSWKAITEYMANRGTGGRRAEFDVSKEDLEVAADSLASFMAKRLNNKQAGEKFRQAVMGRFAKSAIHRNIGEFSETVIDKMAAHMAAWLEFVATTDDGSVESTQQVEVIASVYQMLDAKLRAHKGATADVLVANIL